MSAGIWRICTATRCSLTANQATQASMLKSSMCNWVRYCHLQSQTCYHQLTRPSSRCQQFRYQCRKYSEQSREEKEREFREHVKKKQKTLHRNRMVDIVGLVYLSFGAIYLTAYIGRKLYLRWKGFRRIKVSGQNVKFYEYKGVTVPESLIKSSDQIANFEVRPDDVWVVAFPRSGATWLQEIVYLLTSDLNYEGARNQLLDDRFPHLEWLYPGVKQIAAWKSPRLIKTNLPLTLLPPSIKEQKPKIIYLARNPRDIVVSNYFYSKQIFPITRFNGTFEDFFDMFLDDHVLYAPWSSHVKDFWKIQSDENILFITYEEMQKDISGTVDKIAEFLGKRVSATDKNALIQYCSYDNMKNNTMVNHSWYKDLGVSSDEPFLRKGRIGDWMNYFEKGMRTQLDLWVNDTLSTPDLQFSYEPLEDPSK